MADKSNQENNQKGSFQGTRPTDKPVGSFGGTFKTGPEKEEVQDRGTNRNL